MMDKKEKRPLRQRRKCPRAGEGGDPEAPIAHLQTRDAKNTRIKEELTIFTTQIFGPFIWQPRPETKSNQQGTL
ncbi:hypothetical protein GH733_011983 [Mirounga leonina]|nr:hypothetical protein GH733_011983 [Mirounga leonina]